MGDVADMKTEVLTLRMENKELRKERDTLVRRIDELCAENERMRKTATMLASARTNLLTENAKLRQELAIRESSEQEKVIDYLGKECVDWEDKYLALAGENAKLRELCKTLYQLADESYVPFGSVNRWTDDFAKAVCAMRELRIEVDE